MRLLDRRRSLVLVTLLVLSAAPAPQAGAHRVRVPRGARGAIGQCTLGSDGALARCGLPLELGAGAWCWFADQRAVRIHRAGLDEVVVGWVDPRGDVVVWLLRSDGHQEQKVLSHIYEDDHIAPAISVEPDNRITVYWSAHNGRHMYYETTARAGDISRWKRRQELPSNAGRYYGYTYPNPVILSAERDRHYLFWRGGDWQPSFATRSNHGRWGAAHELIYAPGRRPYVKVATNGRDRIGLAFTDGHPDNVVTSLYFVEIRHGWLYTAGAQRVGRLGGPPVVPGAAELVYDAHADGDVRSWVQDVAFDRWGMPVVVYVLYPPGALGQYWYARWDGRRWDRYLLSAAGPPIQADQPHYVGGVILDHTRPEIVYLSTLVAGSYQAERWTTPDGGHHFSWVELTSGPAANVRPLLAQELPGQGVAGSTLFTMRGIYNSYWDFHTLIVMLSSRFGSRVTGRSPDGPARPPGPPAQRRALVPGD